MLDRQTRLYQPSLPGFLAAQKSLAAQDAIESTSTPPRDIGNGTGLTNLHFISTMSLEFPQEA
jgi:hypothetical protein